MKRITVKLVNNCPDFPLVRQTPNNNSKWGNCDFYINSPINECDYFVVYDELYRIETFKCPKDNTLLIIGEPPNVKKYSQSYLNQFDTIISSRKDIKGKNIHKAQPALPWFVGAKMRKYFVWDSHRFIDFGSLKNLHPKKEKLISVISSNKVVSEEHKNRVLFISKLQEYFGDKIDVYGKGYMELEDKMDAISDYKYTIVIENCQNEDYWTEKLSDAFLLEAYPIYCGCLNIYDYFSMDSLTIIDINRPDDAITIIEKVLNENQYEKSIDQIQKAKDLILNKYNLFSVIEQYVTSKEKSNSSNNENINQVLMPRMWLRTLIKSLIIRFTPFLKKR